MHGQLWEPCPKCDTEPVCVDCGYCTRHCHCASRATDRATISEFNRQYPGFLDRVTRHEEEGEKER